VACDIARAKGADIIIAVNLQRDIKDYDIGSAIDIIAQSISIMMHENNKTFPYPNHKIGIQPYLLDTR